MQLKVLACGDLPGSIPQHARFASLCPRGVPPKVRKTGGCMPACTSGALGLLDPGGARCRGRVP